VGTFQVGGHGVETFDKFAEFFGGGFADAVSVVAVGDGLHGIGQGLDRPCHLLAKVES
jgi:hypothetical protein